MVDGSKDRRGKGRGRTGTARRPGPGPKNRRDAGRIRARASGSREKRGPEGVRAGKSLVVVESPAKARTIARFLGRGFDVRACMGHVRDLPVKELGVDLEHGFTPRYVTIRGKAKVLKELRSAAKKADAVYLAPDPDREGEAIAWHLADQLGNGKAALHRAILNEITQQAVKEAFAAPGEIDQRKVEAQQARRVLDRLVGYQVSPLLWKVVHRRTSAGRVQSVAVRMVVEREEAIRKFVPREYWTLEVELVTPGGERVRAKLLKQSGNKVTVGDEKEARAVENAIRRQRRFQVKELSQKERRRSPRPPFITSTLQQEASQRLRFSPRRSMRVAQELYEGLDIGAGEVVGLITYMRTDSVRLASEAVTGARDYISRRFGPEYVPSRPPSYRRTGRGVVQDAHEAVRPTAVDREPEGLSGLSRDQRRLYDLIWRRLVASQMMPSVDAVTTADIEAGEWLFRALGRIPVFPGYRAVYQDPQEEEKGEAALPALREGEELKLEAVHVKQHFTEPPPRYTEASLIKELEANGVGRPSTYASIVNTITERKYAGRAEGRLSPTELGETVLRILLDAFPDIFTVRFTADMEAKLDRVEAGEDDWQEVVREFYVPFSQDLAEVMARSADLKRSLEDTTDTPCPKCGRMLVIKWGRNGRFLACSGFPECRHSEPLPEEAPPEISTRPCEECGSQMVVRTGRFGRFLACQRYPDCRHTRPLPIGVACPEEKCAGELTERRSRRGRLFYGCSRYPECTFATWDRPVPGPCSSCGSPCLLEKSRRGRATITTCPRCGERREKAEMEETGSL